MIWHFVAWANRTQTSRSKRFACTNTYAWNGIEIETHDANFAWTKPPSGGYGGAGVGFAMRNMRPKLWTWYLIRMRIRCLLGVFLWGPPSTVIRAQSFRKNRRRRAHVICRGWLSGWSKWVWGWDWWSEQQMLSVMPMKMVISMWWIWCSTLDCWTASP